MRLKMATASIPTEPEEAIIEDLSLKYIFDPRDATPRSWRGNAPSYFSLYGLSSWFYTLTGLVLIFLAPLSRISTSFHVYEPFFWVLQGYLSWMNDVHLWGKPSIFKVLDRLHATTFTFAFIIHFALETLINYRYEIIEVSIFLVSLSAGLFSRKSAKEAILKRKYEDFLHWHSMWHVAFPAGRVILALYLAI